MEELLAGLLSWKCRRLEKLPVQAGASWCVLSEDIRNALGERTARRAFALGGRGSSSFGMSLGIWGTKGRFPADLLAVGFRDRKEEEEERNAVVVQGSWTPQL